MRPPRMALWLVEQIAAPDQREAVLGDLQEEFAALSTRTGITAARRWFWWQSARTLVQLIGASIYKNPARLSLSVVGGFLLWWLVAVVVRGAIRSAHYIWPVYYYIDPYSFWLIYAVLGVNVVAPLLVGTLLATLNKGRECVTAVTLAAAVLAWTAGVLLVAPNPLYRHLWLQETLRALLTALSLFAGSLIVRNVRHAPVIRRSVA
jgi:hypothetical protein